jgi:hypothetical protein
MVRICILCAVATLSRCHHLHCSVDFLLQGFERCELRKNPAKDILTRLTLLSLRHNELATLSDALPATSVHNLRLLDIGGNKFSGNIKKDYPPSPASVWPAGNIAAFECGWANLQVLGIQPREPSEVGNGLRATAKKLQRLLQQQADAANAQRPPAIVVWEWDDSDYMRPAEELAVIT